MKWLRIVMTSVHTLHMNTTTHTNSDRAAAQRMVDEVNTAHAAGQRVTVNGRDVRTHSGDAAQVWQNGSVSVDVRTKTGNRVTQMWVKAGQVATVDTESKGA